MAAFSRPVTRSLCLLLAELALGSTCNDYKTIGHAVREVLHAGLERASTRWQWLPEVMATVLTNAQSRCTFTETRLAALRLWGQLLEHELRDASKRKRWIKEGKRRRQALEDRKLTGSDASAPPPYPTVDSLLASEVVIKAITAQSILLEGFMSPDRVPPNLGMSKGGVTEFARLLRHYPRLLPKVYKTRATNPAFSSSSLWLLSALVDFYRTQLPAPALAEAKRDFLEVYLREAINSKNRPSPSVLASFDGLLATVTPEDLADPLGPAVERALKKSPAGVLAAVASLAAQLELDLSPYVDSLFLPPALRMLKSMEEEPRTQAMKLVDTLARKVGDAAAFSRTVGGVMDVLAGKGGVLAQWFQRHACVTALRSLARGARRLPRAALAPAATAALEGLVKAYGKESHEGTRAEIAVGLGDWLGWLEEGASPAPGVWETLKKGLEGGVGGNGKEKEGLLLLLLAVQESLLLSPTLKAPMQGSLEEALARVVKEGAKKAVQVGNLEGMVALHCLVEMDGLEGGKEGQYMKMLTERDSWLFAPSQIEAYARASAPAAMSLARLLLTATRSVGVQAVIGAFPDSDADESLGVKNVNAAGMAFVELLLHVHADVRREAEAVLKFFLAEDPDTTRMALLKSMWVKVHQVASRMEVASQEPVNGSEESESTSSSLAGKGRRAQQRAWPCPQRFAEALTVLFPAPSVECMLKGATPGEEKEVADAGSLASLPMAFLLAYHPLVSDSSRQASALWARLMRGGGLHGQEAVEAAFDDISIDLSDEVIQAVLSQGGPRTHRTAGQRCMCALASTFGHPGREVLFEGIIPALLTQLQRPELVDLNAVDVAVYFHSPSSVYQTQKLGAAAGGKGQEREAQMRRMRTGRRGNVYDAEEEKWEEEFKRKKAEEKEKQGGGQGGTTPEERRVLEEEAAIRDRVGALRQEAVVVFDAIVALAKHEPAIAHMATPDALPVLLPLLRTRLLHDEAFHTLRALASTVERNIQPIAWDLAAAVRLVAVMGDEHPKAFRRLADVLARVINYLSAFSSHVYKERLSAPLFCFLFSVLRAVLTDVCPGLNLGELYEEALSILAAHADFSQLSDIPLLDVGPSERETLRPFRKAMMETTLYVLRAHPRSEPAPGGILIALMMGPSVSVGEWAPVLGNEGLLSPEASVRLAVLEAVEAMAGEKTGAGKASLTGNPLLESRLWLTLHDEDAEVAEAGERVWKARGAALSGLYSAPLLVLLGHNSARVRAAVGRALAAAMVTIPETATATLNRLMDLCQANLPTPENEERPRGEAYLLMPLGEEEASAEEKAAKEQEKAGAREGVALALQEVGKKSALPSEGLDKHLQAVFTFLLRIGAVDPHDTVRQYMVSAGMALIDAYGATQAIALLPIFEGVLEAPAAPGENLSSFDWRREGTVVLMGSTARHLDASDPKILSIMDRLLDALSTPSGPVQRAVALCMVPLMPACKSQAGDYAAKLLANALKGEDYGTRRGAAYGISALVKGLGIASLKQHGIMSALEQAAASPSPPAKQGALFCFECLCTRLKLLFEPYVIVILPLLLRCFSDSSDHVREAASLAAKAIMGNLSPHGVKLVLPTILKALDDSAWRSKAAALSLLGAMAYCAPKQLSSCLPQIVPRMTEAFGDTHPKVRESGKAALGDIGKVIRNPEIRKLSPLLLSALYDPAKNTKDALEGLLACEFMHSVDAPSLALLIPIVQRGLKDRAADLKRKASLITGNMCSMISDARDLVPYLPALLPGLKSALVDPIPDVRATTARALGSLMRGMGEESLFDLVPWLVELLKTDASSVERSGGAQGLAQVLVSLGDARVKAVLTDLLALKGHPRFSVREGILWLLSFLPPALGPGFTPYISNTLPVILAGLTDETESVREVALRAGQVLVSTHGKHHADEILPSLEAGLFDDSWRIRQSSVQLLGDLLYTIGGTKAVGLAMDDAGEDDVAGRGVSRAEIAINSVLGPKRRAKILASLYVIRSDTSAVVRQSALQVWKTVVTNTPRVLREVLPVLIEILIGALASNNLDKRTVGGRALGDIVRKLGDQILPEIVPHLRHELEVGDTNMRQGVCLGLAEIMDCAQKKQIEDFAATLVEAILDALTDPAASVREEAGQAFLAFHRILGSDAVAKVVPPMLMRLDEEQKSAEASERESRERGEEQEEDKVVPGRALLGVRELLRARPREVLGYLLPKLTKPPVSISHARTLEAVAEVTGSTLHYHASVLLPLLVGQMLDIEQVAEEEKSENEAMRLLALESCTRTIVTSVESNGLQHLVVDLTKLLESSDAATRRRGTWAVKALAEGTQADLRPQAPILLKFLLPLLNDTEESVWRPTVQALRALLDRLGVEEALGHLDFMRNVVASVVSNARRRKGGVGDAAFALPGLNVPGGLDPFLPVYTQGLLQGTPNQKEVAASWMGELLELMEPTSLRPYIAKIVGPLIRIASDKTFSPSIKCAILNTMTLLLEKGGSALRGLAPQLQTTFTKALSDIHQNVRDRAGKGLGRLVPLSTRLDPLVTELVTGAVSSPSGLDVQIAMLKALGQVLGAAGEKVSVAVVTRAIDQLAGLLHHEQGPLRKASAGAVGRVVALLPADETLDRVIRKDLLTREGGGKWKSAEGRSLALGATLKFSLPDNKLVAYLDDVVETLKNDVGTEGAAAPSEQGPVRDAALRALARLVIYADSHQTPEAVNTSVTSIVPEISASLLDMSSEVRKAAAGLIRTTAKVQPAALRPHLVKVIPPLLEGVRDMDIRVKYVSERALLYALEIHSRPETLGEFIALAPMDSAKFVRDYAKRILIRLKADSEDENEDGEEEN